MVILIYFIIIHLFTSTSPQPFPLLQTINDSTNSLYCGDITYNNMYIAIAGGENYVVQLYKKNNLTYSLLKIINVPNINNIH